MSYSITNRDKRVMDFLRRSAIDNEGYGNAKIASAISIKGKIISLGHNSPKTHPFQSLYSKNAESVYLHAETSAISNSLNHMGKTELEKATIYVYRVKRSVDNVKIWSSGLSKPCKGCMRAITDFNIKRIVYSTDEDTSFEVYKRTN